VKPLLIAGLLAALTTHALAQAPTPSPHAQAQNRTPLPKVIPGPATEEITVTSNRLRSIIRNFVDTATAPSPIGQVSRWKVGLCPRTTGMGPGFTAFVTKRVREIATDLGVPVNPDENCSPNLQIIFTEHPQAMLDIIRTKLPALLGYHYAAQARELSTVEHPIQGWYATGSRDRMGQLVPDNPYGVSTMTVEGSRIKTGLRSEFVAVTVVVDLITVENQEIGAIADHIALLAFSQSKAFERCRTVPSIANMLLDCDASLKPSAP